MARDRTNIVVAWAGLLGFCAVAAGAFGAHAVADPKAKAWLQSGAEYGMVCALAALAALGVQRLGGRTAGAAAWCFLAGGAVFSGALYALALTRQPLLGAVAPIGGVLMLAGWALLAGAGFTVKPTP